jgi:BMFP domain-containing protein YqiC
MTDRPVITQIRQLADTLRVRASLESAKAEEYCTREYLDEFARDLEKLCGDTLTLALTALDILEREREEEYEAKRYGNRQRRSAEAESLR